MALMDYMRPKTCAEYLVDYMSTGRLTCLKLVTFQVQRDADHEEDDTECDDSFHSLNSALIEHFDVVSGENGIKWPRRNK
jgi:hypothetical protein